VTPLVRCVAGKFWAVEVAEIKRAPTSDRGINVAATAADDLLGRLPFLEAGYSGRRLMRTVVRTAGVFGQRRGLAGLEAAQPLAYGIVRTDEVLGRVLDAVIIGRGPVLK
jgi:hypothetical protein